MNEPQRHGDTEKRHGETDKRDGETEKRDGDGAKHGVNDITSGIIGAAIAVHRVLGPGLLESIYEAALCVEFDERGIRYARQQRVPAYYKGRRLGTYVVDLLVEELVVVEIKSVATILPVLVAQLMTYMRLLKKSVGLLINFNTAVLKDGIVRRVL
jgi:GxxExxY protein